MSVRSIYLIDESGTQVALLDVTPVDEHFEGTISLESTPPQLKQLFEQFEEVVEGGIFGLLDDIEEKIGGIPLKAAFDNGSSAYVYDLQVFPSTNAVSFKTREFATGV